MVSSRRTLLSVLATAFTLILAQARPSPAAIPAGFADTLVTAIGSPTDIAFTPDGRLLITRQTGSLRVFQGGALLATPAISFATANICTNSERGLLGVAVDPAFATNRRIYLYYTVKRASDSACKNRVSRFILPDTNVIDPASEVVLLDNMNSQAGNHNGGDVHFGNDGYLYVSIGDGGCDYASPSSCAGSNDASRDEFMLLGKILRITSDGGIPPTNPFQGAGTARCNMTGGTTPGTRCQETFAWGLRNPFRFAFDPNTASNVSRFFINDVGQGAWEEIDLGQAGVDYGWNCREGRHTNNTSGPCSPTPAGMVDPIFEYSHSGNVPGTSVGGCASITGGAFVPNGLWPGYDGAFLFADYVCGAIFKLADSGASGNATSFATGLGGSSAVAMIFGPFGSTQALYYTTYAAGGQVRRINTTSTNNAPTAMASGSPLFGPTPLTVTFDATGSSDPDAGDTLTYFWTFGDGTPETSTTNLTIQHTYTAAGTVTAQLRVRDNNLAFSAPVTLQVQPGNQPPSPTITSPAAAATFRVGQTVTLTGSATDPQDGTLPASSLSWTVILHHNTHTHPFLGPVTGNNIQFTAPPPEDLAATDSSFLEIRLTATDSQSLAATVTQNFQPHRVSISFNSVPGGVTLSVNGAAVTTPQTVTSWEAWGLNLAAPPEADLAAQAYLFTSWSDGGAMSHTVATPASGITLTANYQISRDDGPSDFFTVVPCRAVDTRGADGPALAGGASRVFGLTGTCGIPATATAVAANVTVIPSGMGYLAFHRADESPGLTSTINFRPGVSRGNNAILPLSAAGGVEVLCGASGTVHLVIDVVGYFD
jgi:glucose/arabinose dehydrogenase